MSRTNPVAVVPEPRSAQPFSAMALLADPALDVRQYLEDLVTIAVNSAQQAEDVAQHAQEASRRARRGMALVGSLGVLGVLVGAAGFTASRSSNVRLSEVRDEISTLQDMQRQAQDQRTDLTAKAAESDQRDAVEVTHQMAIAPAAVTVRPLPTPASPPVRQPQVQYYQPWPDSRPQPRRVPVVRSRSTVVVPQFFADIQRNFRAIFR